MGVAPVQEKDKKFEKKFGPPQSDNICRGSGGILHQKMFEFRVSEMAFAAFWEHFWVKLEDHKSLFFVVYHYF